MRTGPRVNRARVAWANRGELLGPAGLTARSTTFTRPDAIMPIAERLPHGASASYVVEIADRLLAPSAVERLEEATPGRPAAYTTRELLRCEHELVATAQRIPETTPRAVSARTVERIVETHTRRDGLTSEQADAVRILATSERGLGLLGGAARSGKTSSLAAFAEALDYGRLHADRRGAGECRGDVSANWLAVAGPGN